MKAREFLAELRGLGAVHVRNRGDHQIWKLPNGRVLSVPIGGKHNELRRGTLFRLRRLMQESG